MKNVKYRFKQIDRIGKLFGETYLADKWINGNTKYGGIELSKTNYNEEMDIHTSYDKEDNTLYIKNNIFREGKLVCIFKDYPCSVYFSKIKIYNKPLFNKYKNNILLRGVLENNTVYFMH